MLLNLFLLSGEFAWFGVLSCVHSCHSRQRTEELFRKISRDSLKGHIDSRIASQKPKRTTMKAISKFVWSNLIVQTMLCLPSLRTMMKAVHGKKRNMGVLIYIRVRSRVTRSRFHLASCYMRSLCFIPAPGKFFKALKKLEVFAITHPAILTLFSGFSELTACYISQSTCADPWTNY